MSDKELSDYIKTIDPKFNSNLEKGTIEMTNEYYNLLEEYIARLNNKKDLYKGVLDKIKELVNKEEFTMQRKFKMREDILKLLEEIE